MGESQCPHEVVHLASDKAVTEKKNLRAGVSKFVEASEETIKLVYGSLQKFLSVSTTSDGYSERLGL